MKRRCPHCQETTISLGALWKGEFRNRAVVCMNCGKSIRSRHSQSWLKPIADVPAMMLADVILLFLVALVASTYFGAAGAGAAVVATIALSVALLTLTPLVFPLQIVRSEPEEKWTARYPRIAFIRACFLILVWIGFLTLAIIFIVRMIAALL